MLNLYFGSQVKNRELAGSVYEEKWSFNILGLTFSSKVEWGFYIITLSLLLKLPPRKFEPWFVLWRLLCISINLPCAHHGTLLSRLVWCPYLLLGIVRQAIKTNMKDLWSFTCCFSWTLGSSSKYRKLKSFL